MVAAIAIGVKYVLDWFFISVCHWSVGGISLATSAITVLNLSLLTYFLRKKIGRLGTSTMLKPVASMLVGGVVCGALSAATFLLWDRYGTFELVTDKVGSRSFVLTHEPRFALQDFRIRLLRTKIDDAIEKRLELAEADRQSRGQANTSEKGQESQQLEGSLIFENFLKQIQPL
jgi:hypothetical protein